MGLAKMLYGGGKMKDTAPNWLRGPFKLKSYSKKDVEAAELRGAETMRDACERVAFDYETMTREKEVGTVFLSHDEIETKYHTGHCPIAIRAIDPKKVLEGK